MTTGESCTYKIKSCGAAPAFAMKNSSTATDSKVNITFVEFNEKKMNMTKAGKPIKNCTVKNSGPQGNDTKGGQAKPARKRKDGKMTKNETVEGEKKAVEE